MALVASPIQILRERTDARAKINRADGIMARNKLGKAVSVFVVDRQPAFVKGMVCGFQDDPQIKIVGTGQSFGETEDVIWRISPDVITLDFIFPESDPLSDIRGAIAKNWHVLVIGGNHAASQIDELAKIGSRGFISKNESIAEIGKAIRVVGRGGTAFPLESESSTLAASLSKRQKETLELLCQGLTAKEIGTKLQLSRRTVEAYKHALLVKLCVRNSLELSRLAFQKRLV
jgi:DNA-binding NarL/FixJ family response regulator